MAAIKLGKASAFSRVRVRDFGSVEEIADVPNTIDDVVTIWTHCTRDENPFATVRIRGVIDSTHGLVWLPANAKVDVVEPPRYAGQPEDLIKQATLLAAPHGSKGAMKTADGWPSLIWDSDLVHSPVQGWDDCELAVEVLMCALTVAPDTDPMLRPVLLAGLKARYAALRSDKSTYPPKRYPWRGRTEPGRHMLDYLKG